MKRRQTNFDRYRGRRIKECVFSEIPFRKRKTKKEKSYMIRKQTVLRREFSGLKLFIKSGSFSGNKNLSMPGSARFSGIFYRLFVFCHLLLASACADFGQMTEHAADVEIS